ncbi:GCN5-related N-acetyltransferase [Desulfofarcimen acetoxidans DSM 771]|uniref:GCN5-related N-acetyltransferase n=1 Tax=Desulfofarcimen acetoxidans (strain ATCC 49208 / DSM 771 / KCTC 5769 / VKM B-1644 / 5575) TaxID=485916 RepID=C8W0V6_DESAS|nr:GNAT family N-acetyltransferase [Desulfofarcimen acetoxidans]ACV63361.1 GCN5-related N-acetyltransferase [Desulfofarcimen acetoxidans DSM 771]
MLIRKATISDVSAIAKVTVDTWKTTYRGIIPDDYLDSLTYEEREKGWMEFPFHHFIIYIAEDENHNIVGFAAAGLERTSNPIYKGEIYAIYVLESYQNKGIGSSLIKAIMNNFKQLDIYSVIVWVLSDNNYRRFYELHQGQKVDCKQFDFNYFEAEITSYGWTDIREIF